MTDDAKTETAADVLAEQAQERDVLAALIVAAAQPKPETKPGLPWRVVGQNGLLEWEVSAHRFEWRAELRAHRLAARCRTETGQFYTARRAES